VRRDRRVRSDAVAVKFGQNLRRCRHQAGLSQEELGELASLHRTEIGMVENGTRLARVDTMMKLAGALEISPMELLKGIEWTPTPVLDGEFVIHDPAYQR
jgi:transcriptional regulator with XRE-family HTH domain